MPKSEMQFSAVNNSVLQAIGNTPTVRLRNLVKPGMADVIVKLEYYSPTGSYKDRMALAMIEGAEARNELRPGMRVVEYTGGSTGTSLALVCAVKGYKFSPVSSNAFAREKLQTMRLFGADLHLIESSDRKLTPDLFQKMIATAAKMGAEPNSFYTDQFNNKDSIQGYTAIADELLQQVDMIDVFCAGVGTAGMLVGVSRGLKRGG